MRSQYLGPWRVDVEWRDAIPHLLPARGLARVVVAALEAGGAPRPASIGLILADDAELATLNASHMGKDGPTDVLSVPLLPPGRCPRHPGNADDGLAPSRAFVLPPGQRTHIGDVVVSVERAIDQAEQGRGGQ